MQKDYSKYTSKELLEDDFFIESMLFPTSETDELWNTLIKEELIEKKEFEHAKTFMLIMCKPQKAMTLRERTDLWTGIEIKNKKNLLRKIRIRNICLVASVAALLTGVFILPQLLLKNNETGFEEIQTIIADLPAVKNELTDIQLILSDKKTVGFEDKKTDVVLNEKGEIHVNSVLLSKEESVKKEKKKEPEYNQLIVPYGKHSKLTLADGTRMYINSGTSVAFPDKFSENKREIYVNGEVYLEVAHDDKAPFYVYTNNMNICVLGTVLNVKAYNDDDKHSVVLVSGAVSVRTKENQEARLHPNQKFSYSSENSIISPVDVENYISWKDGYFLYRREPIQDIIKQLSRYYQKEIVCTDSLAAITCSGKLDLKDDFDKVINDLSDILSLKIINENDTYYLYRSLTRKN